MTLNLQGKMYLIYVLPVLKVSPNLKFHAISLYDAPFSRYRPFWDKCRSPTLNDPKMTSNTTRSNVLYICVTNIPVSNFKPIFLYNQPFSRYKVVDHFRDTKLSIIGNTPNNLRMTLETCQKYPVYIKYLPPRYKFLSVSLYDQLFSRYKVVENQQNQKCTWLIMNT